MNVKQKLLLVLSLLVSSVALADGPCPDGTFNPGPGVCMCPAGGSVGPNQYCEGGGGRYLISRWGAIAVNFGGSGWAFSHSAKSQEVANNEALDLCRKHGPNCKVAVMFKNTCAAMAWDTRAVGAAIDTNKKLAEQMAMQQCIQKGGKNCILEVKAMCAGSPE